MREANMLYLVVSKFCDVDLHPDRVPNEQMGLIFENLIRRFNELANETAGDHFTPREVIRLMVSILFYRDDKLLATPGTVRKLLDPAAVPAACSPRPKTTSASTTAPRVSTSTARITTSGLRHAASDMLMKEVDHNGALTTFSLATALPRINSRPTLSTISSPTALRRGLEETAEEIEREHEKVGFAGRFGAGLPV